MADHKELILRLLLALVIGGLTGLEREKSHQFAGFRTHILVSVGSCITSLTSLYLLYDYGGVANVDPARLTAQVLSGIGFLGAGAILKTSNGIRGLTTAAGIWATACIGMTIGYGYYVLSISAWLFVMITLYILKNIDKFILRKKHTIINVTIDNMGVISIIYSIFKKSKIEVRSIDIAVDDEGLWKLSFYLVHDRRIIIKELVKELKMSKNIVSVDYLH